MRKDSHLLVVKEVVVVSSGLSRLLTVEKRVLGLLLPVWIIEE